MRRTSILSVVLAAVVLVATPCRAQSGSAYDWRSGNSYNWTTQPNGTTNLNGFNSGTGSQWNTTIQPNGNMNGSDSRGNTWTYDKGTGNYFNSGTGRSCFGEGAGRVCY